MLRRYIESRTSDVVTAGAWSMDLTCNDLPQTLDDTVRAQGLRIVDMSRHTFPFVPDGNPDL